MSPVHDRSKISRLLNRLLEKGHIPLPFALIEPGAIILVHISSLEIFYRGEVLDKRELRIPHSSDALKGHIKTIQQVQLSSHSWLNYQYFHFFDPSPTLLTELTLENVINGDRNLNL